MLRQNSDSIFIPKMLDEQRIKYIDGLRTVSIFLGIIGHLNVSYFKYDFITRLFGSGGLGVTFFFVISGFLITTLFIKERIVNGDISIKRFYIRRALRILPVAYLYILILALLNYYFNLQIPLFYFLAAAFFVSNISRINHEVDLGNGRMITHYWSLSVEEQFYLFYPFVFKIFKKSLLIFLVIGIVVINIFKSFESHTYFFYFYESILVGCISSLLVFKLKLDYRKIGILSYSIYMATNIHFE